MLKFHDAFYLSRQLTAVCRMSNTIENERWIEAGACLDAPDEAPAGSTVRVDGEYTDYPFAASSREYLYR